MSQAFVFIAAVVSFGLWATSYLTGSVFVAIVAAIASAFTLGGWTFGIRKHEDGDGEKAPSTGSVLPVREPRPAPAPEPVQPARQPTADATDTSAAVSPSIRFVQPDAVNPDAVVRALLRNAAFSGHPVATHMWLEDPPTATLRLVASAGERRPSSDPIRLDADEPTAEAIRTSAAALAPVSKLTTSQAQETVWRYAVPIGAENATGVAAIDIAQQDRPDTALLNEIAASLRLSLSGALALDVARRRERTTKALMTAVRSLSRTLDPAKVLREALATAMRLSEASTGSVMLLSDEDGRLRIAVAEGLPADVVADTSLAIGEGIAGWVATSGQGLLVEDLPGAADRSDRHGVRSAASVPIADEDGLLGVLNVGSRTFPARFTTEHLESLELLGRQTAVALRNARAASTAGELYFDSLKALALAIETKDPYAQGGTERVLDEARSLGRAVGLKGDRLRALEIAAMLHDIGMAGVTGSTAACSRPLSTVEQALIKMHPVIAADILRQAPALKDVVPIVYHHHEHFDGAGYVSGASGDDIPLAARVLAVADAYVAMTSDRPYRAAMSHASAVGELREKAGTQFDPDVVQAFIDLQGTVADRAPKRER